MSAFAYDTIATKLPGAILERYADRARGEWALLQPSAIREVASLLKNDPHLDFRLFVSMDVVDRLLLPDNTPRFELVYFLRSLKRNELVRLKLRAEGEPPAVPSLTPVFQGANWWERLAWDFYGVKFTGHPDPRRILLFEEFVGHPLRKDYPLRGRQPLVPERPIQDIFRGPGTNGVL